MSGYVPVVMHPLNFDIIYLWNRSVKEAEEDGKCMDGCILSFNGCSEYKKGIRRYYLPWYEGGPNNLLFPQYVHPRWVHRLPRPQSTYLVCTLFLSTER
ncbi:hypothetical protein YC2023_082710 [Brassica napus]